MSLHKLPLLPLKNKKLWKHVGSMKPKKERGPSNQIGLANSHGQNTKPTKCTAKVVSFFLQFSNSQ